MTKKLILLFIFIFLFLKTSIIYAEEIKDYQVEIFINKNGIINVKEKIVYDFGDLKRHGIYRTIPFVKKTDQGQKWVMSLENFTVTDEKSYIYPFQIIKQGERIQLKIGDPNKTISGLHHYFIYYQVYGALSYFFDHDELYWNAIGTDWPVTIKKASVQVFLPNYIEEKAITATCYQGRFGSQQLCQSQINKNSVNFFAENLQANNGLTIVVGFPKNLVQVLEPKKYNQFWKELMWERMVNTLLNLLSIFWRIFLPFYIIFKWFMYGRDPKGTVGVTTAWFDPPKTADNKRFLTPGEVGVLGDEMVDLKDIAATIVDLARRGYIKIIERRKNDFYLERQQGLNESTYHDDQLLEYEQMLLDKFFKSKIEISLKNKYLYKEINEIKKSLYEQTVRDGLFPKNPDSVRSFYFIITILAIITSNMPLAFISFVFGLLMPRKTIAGVNAKNVAFSLKNFLSSQERQLEFQADKQIMFERLLPYAIVFGVEKIWAKRFQDLQLKQPNWYQGYYGGDLNSTIFVNNLNSIISIFKSSATPRRSSSGFLSGFSGGFSGGGGGGGGGGSW